MYIILFKNCVMHTLSWLHSIEYPNKTEITFVRICFGIWIPSWKLLWCLILSWKICFKHTGYMKWKLLRSTWIETLNVYSLSIIIKCFLHEYDQLLEVIWNFIHLFSLLAYNIHSTNWQLPLLYTTRRQIV